MSASLPGSRPLPASRYDLRSYWGRVKQAADVSDPRPNGASRLTLARTLLVSSAGLEHAKSMLAAYKTGAITSMTPELWRAKKVVDSTLHPDTGRPVLLPLRMSCFVLSNLVVTAGMLTPGLGTAGTIAWQVANQSLNVAINTANANQSTPLSTAALVRSYLLAVSASVSVAVGLNALVPRLRILSPGARLVATRLVPFAAVATAGALNVTLMRSGELRNGIDVYPAGGEDDGAAAEDEKDGSGGAVSLGKSRKAGALAVGETALSRVLNATPVMAIPPLVLVRLQRTNWLRARPGLTLPVNLGLILTTSLFALPLALGVFPQRQAVPADSLEPEFHGRGGRDGLVEFNRGI